MDDVNTYFSADRGRDGLFLAITPQKHKTVMPAAGVLDNSGSLTAYTKLLYLFSCLLKSFNFGEQRREPGVFICRCARRRLSRTPDS